MATSHDDIGVDDVKVLLAAAGIEPPDHDLPPLVRALAVNRRRVDRMFEVPTGDEVPAAIFRAEVSS